MDLIGEKVTNAKYGTGTITAIDGGYVTVQFSEKTCKYKYPDAFHKHISIANASLQSEIQSLATAAVEEKAAAEEKAKAQMFKDVMQSVEAAKAPVKKEPSNKTGASFHKKTPATTQKGTIKWDPGKRRTYYVFQGGTFDDEYAGGYIWAPYESKYGGTFHYWDRLKDLKAGDMIFHAVRGNIKAISIVREPSIIAARPEGLVGMYAEDNHGYLVRCTYTFIDNPISAWDYTEQTKEYSQVKYAPLNINGTGNLGYLYELDQRLATLFLEESVKKNPALGEIDFVSEFLA